MRIRRIWRSINTFMTQLGAALVKTVFTSVVVAIVVVAAMHYMGVPVPSVLEVLHGVSRLARGWS